MTDRRLISRRELVVGAGAALAATAFPAGVVEAAAAEMPPAVDPGALPATFDPAAFIDDQVSTGHRVAVHQPVRVTFDPDKDLRPYFWIYPEPGGGFNRAYGEVMKRWADRLDATPDHVERVVRYALGQRGDAT